LPARRATIPLVALALLLAGCGRPQTATGPEAALQTKKSKPDTSLGFPLFATKNTTRVASGDPVLAAAAVSRAVYTGSTAPARPRLVTIVDERNWTAALAATALLAPPVRAPILFADGPTLPDPTAEALKALAPRGSEAAGGAQVLRIATAAAPGGVKTTDIRGTNPFAVAKEIDSVASAIRGTTSSNVIVVSADDPQFAIPAAAYSAKSGDPILFTHRNSVPAETIAAIKSHTRPTIYVLGPSSIISPSVTRELRKVGTVVRTGGQDPSSNSIEFARYLHGSFGWGIVDPGHGLVFARTAVDPATAAAVAPLSSSGTYGPLLLLDNADSLTKPMAQYLLDIQPGYQNDPVRGVYNRGWLIGDIDAIKPSLQSEIDRYLEIVPVSQKALGSSS
jgi:hypothetical protein